MKAHRDNSDKDHLPEPVLIPSPKYRSVKELLANPGRPGHARFYAEDFLDIACQIRGKIDDFENEDEGGQQEVDMMPVDQAEAGK